MKTAKERAQVLMRELINVCHLDGMFPPAIELIEQALEAAEAPLLAHVRSLKQDKDELKIQLRAQRETVRAAKEYCDKLEEMLRAAQDLRSEMAIELEDSRISYETWQISKGAVAAFDLVFARLKPQAKEPV